MSMRSSLTASLTKPMIECDVGNLVSAARSAAEFSYSPYSKFRVGAAVLAGGKIYQGCNIENGSYGLTICAERVAIFAAIADGKRDIEALAVSCIDVHLSGSQNLMMPCGACRQVIEEILSPNSIIIVDGVGQFNKESLLPIPFRLKLR
jgi:cytidine deaminase